MKQVFRVLLMVGFLVVQGGKVWGHSLGSSSASLSKGKFSSLAVQFFSSLNQVVVLSYQSTLASGDWLVSLKQLLNLALELKKHPKELLALDASLYSTLDLFLDKIQLTIVELERTPPLLATARQQFQSLVQLYSSSHTLRAVSIASTTSSKIPDSIDPLERAEGEAILRNFDLALQRFEAILFGSTLPLNAPIDPLFRIWKKALDSALAIAIRAKNSPQQALSFIEKVLVHPTAPYFIKQTSLQWKLSLESWLKEPQGKVSSSKNALPSYSSLVELRKKILALMGEAHSRQRHPQDRSADVLYLRASALIHELLERDTFGTYQAEAFMLAGICYQTLSFPFPEAYYEACIRVKPHSPLARTCYQHYEEFIHLSYTGTSGTFIPTDLEQKLQQQKQLAFPKESLPQPL